MNPFQELYQKNKLKGVSDSKATKEYSENSFLFKKYSGKSEFLNPYFSFRGRILSKIAFGSYRVGLESTEHEKSIELSLSMGFNVIDTSSNYGDGESESLIGKVLQKKIQKGELKRENVFIITKVGYIQGKNLEIVTELENTNRAFPEITYYQEGCYHCIHPFFLEDQLEYSLKRLGLETVDVFLLHNPEYFLMDREKHNVPKEKATEQYYERIKSSFRFLEQKRKEGKILYYGISSNTFSENPEKYTSTSLIKILKIAKEVQSELGLEESGFAVVQFPGNLLESGFLDPKFEGKNLISIIHENGLLPLINRPLNAISNSGNIYRLSYDPKKESEHILNLLKERLDTIYKREEVLLAVLPQGSYKYTFRTVTEPYLNQFQNQNHLNQFLERTVIPILQQLIAQIEKIGGVKVQAEYIETLNEALPILEQYVFQKNIESRKSLYSKIINLYPNYQSWNLSTISLHLLHSSLRKGVVLLGMRKEEYVKDATFSFAASETEIQYQDWKQFEV
ncbi:aldo/keto reductase [Leptospira interrogans]|uniref:aldo/keto reductase n=1 Tax=Leptospira interrogans TaxID=173 RepID=UPI0002BA2383|nr:aldo/keto reductase [Leptospira interrogans]KAA1266909.1 aldo/keto reductase [Leptospira interrogans serovar Weerasinghe]AKH77483.1 aldo/keto reductase [Leptospira interrogans serovar Bratislava]EMN07578.1 oxidoreductase, aldo/keto reductase family protein [Leptospira interrogans serovar Muenchen str. Brem 129]KGE26538.1 aldo/keto reductase [Leptospira interrogans serovar Lai]KLO75192.1 Oxidoreductase, aldo/keto reductase family protein [Leptospira interrogans serovar Muenchen]